MKYIYVFLYLILSQLIITQQNQLHAQELRPDEQVTGLQIDVTDPNLYKPQILDDFSDAGISYQVISQKKLNETNAQKISDVIKLDTSLSESYSSIGYSDSVAIRGISLDSQNNYLRDGLPFLVNAPVPLINKSRVEIIKGTYGILSGLSSPGGLINYVTEKPTSDIKTVLKTELSSAGQYGAGVAASSAIDNEKKYLYRIDLAATKLNTNLKNSSGQKYLASLAFETTLNPNLIVETNIESSYQSQPSQAGFSLLGSDVPTNITPDINLNNQDWTQPVEFRNSIAVLKMTYLFDIQTKASLSALGQNTLTNDRIAFPFGCSAENNYDRYCSDGTFDMYDFRSENEKRRNHVLKLQFDHQFDLADVKNKVSLSYLNRNVIENFDKQAYNYSGVGNVDGQLLVPEKSDLNDENTNKKSETNEFTVFYQLKINQITATAGLKHAILSKQSLRTNETRKTDIEQNFNLPWATLSYQFENVLIYSSYSEGIESYVTPNKPSYTHPGQNISDAISRQTEVGLKSTGHFSYGLSLFRMIRPQIEDASPIYTIDGQQINTGAEINIDTQIEKYDFGISALFLDSRTVNAEVNPSKNNKITTNIPNQKFKFELGYNSNTTKGFSVNSSYVYSSERYITADNSLRLPSWYSINVGTRYKWDNSKSISLHVDNLFDRKYWKESPTQFSHVYLFPGESRTLSMIYAQELN
jgi:iron complex outermembrane receptor protein